MQDAGLRGRIRRKYELLTVEMDERRRRQWAAAEARFLSEQELERPWRRQAALRTGSP